MLLHIDEMKSQRCSLANNESKYNLSFLLYNKLYNKFLFFQIKKIKLGWISAPRAMNAQHYAFALITT